jgi:hypothetical protein
VCENITIIPFQILIEQDQVEPNFLELTLYMAISGCVSAGPENHFDLMTVILTRADAECATALSPEVLWDWWIWKVRHLAAWTPKLAVIGRFRSAAGGTRAIHSMDMGMTVIQCTSVAHGLHATRSA